MNKVYVLLFEDHKFGGVFVSISQLLTELNFYYSDDKKRYFVAVIDEFGRSMIYDKNKGYTGWKILTTNIGEIE